MDLAGSFEKYAGAIAVGAFCLVMARIVYWLLVIVPGKTKEIYARLEATGYSSRSPDDGAVVRLLAQHAAIFPKDPPIGSEVPAWRVRRAVVRDQWGCRRLIVNAQRWQLEQTGVRNSNLSCSTTILVETRELPLREDVHFVPAENRGRIRWKERYHLPPASSGLDPELLEHYEVHAAPDAAVTLPGQLASVLIEVCPLLLDQSRFCFQHGVSMRFGCEGWGITTSNEIYKQEDMDLLLDVAGRISGTLRS
jgi:hypothetical protein